jgi:hypothetical protein
MRNLCKCGCGELLRKDNRTGYQKGHKPCPICGTLVKGSGVECCSKSCSAKLHWQRNPEMKESRIWNAERYATREKNRHQWVSNISKSCKGRTPWNKGTKGLQEAWNKFLPSEKQPFYGKKHKSDFYNKVKKTNLEKYGIENCGSLASHTPYSKKELSLKDYLPGYIRNARIGKYRPDYVNQERKHIIEFNGDFWHCNPALYEANFYHPGLKMTAAEKWNLDQQRKEYLESLGYSVTVVWESDLEEFIGTLK